jgi:putative Mg2+ transporter-C (MgtC) family protein
MVFHEITQYSVIMRILVAIVIGGMLGLERGMKNRPAGLRTYMLVCVGSCLIMMTNQYIYQFTGAGDPMRLGAQVVSGIGFLGAGTIVVTRHNQIKGLTTAAGLWASAGVGLALGIGFYEGAITAGVSIYLILTILQKLEDRVHKKIRVLELYVELRTSVSIAEFLQSLRALDLKLENIQFEPEGSMEVDTRAVILTLKAKRATDHKTLRDKIRRIDGVVHLEEL